MRVVEKNSDRKAEVNLYAAGSVKPLDEYAEYIDPTDNAICCFVPVSEGKIIRSGGKFYGTTNKIQSDISIDGVYRRTLAHTPKSIAFQKNKELGSAKYIYKLPDGNLVESEIEVERVHINADDKAPLSIGTIEIRVWVLRRLGDELGYKSICPGFAFRVEENSEPLNNRAAKNQMRLMSATRPGTEPWAIFRFHYRSKEAISEARMEHSFAHDWKKKREPTVLRIEELPPLEVGPKVGQPGDNEGTPCRQPSVTPSVAGSSVENTFKESPSPTTNNSRIFKPNPKPAHDTSGHETSRQPTSDNAETMTDIQPCADEANTKPNLKPTLLTITPPTIPALEPNKDTNDTVAGCLQQVLSSAAETSKGAIEPLPCRGGPPTPTTPIKRSLESCNGMDLSISPSVKRTTANPAGILSVQSPRSDPASLREKVREWKKITKQRNELAPELKKLHAKNAESAKKIAEIEERLASSRAEYGRELREFEEAKRQELENEEALRALEGMDSEFEG